MLAYSELLKIKVPPVFIPGSVFEISFVLINDNKVLPVLFIQPLPVASNVQTIELPLVVAPCPSEPAVKVTVSQSPTTNSVKEACVVWQTKCVPGLVGSFVLPF